MNRTTHRRLEPRSSLMSLIASCALMAVVIAPASLLIAALASGGASPGALMIAALAGGICWIAAALALCVTWFGNRFHAPVQAMLGGMLFRMGLPLLAIVGLPKLGEPFSAAGITTTLLGVYFVALVMETALAVRLVPQKQQSAPAA